MMIITAIDPITISEMAELIKDFVVDIKELFSPGLWAVIGGVLLLVFLVGIFVLDSADKAIAIRNAEAIVDAEKADFTLAEAINEAEAILDAVKVKDKTSK